MLLLSVPITLADVYNVINLNVTFVALQIKQYVLNVNQLGLLLQMDNVLKIADKDITEKLILYLKLAFHVLTTIV
jgi:hypothetical protein